MLDQKQWWMSKTVWGVVVMMATVLLSRFGYVITPEIQEGIVAIALDAVAVVSGIVALWGRIVATKKLQ